jgi:serine/threonine protein phosphatase 1
MPPRSPVAGQPDTGQIEAMGRFIQYAIGDIHGMLDRLQLLYARIREDMAMTKADARLVHLGDYIDRGPDSYGVIEAVIAMEAEGKARGFEVVSLRGNHEQMLLDAYEDPEGGPFRTWVYNGGDMAVASYARMFAGHPERWTQVIPHAHIKWLNSLPTILRDEDNSLVFVHAGIDPAVFPNCEDNIRIWTRSEKFFDFTRWPVRPQLKGLKVIHGHTPTDTLQAEVQRHRINVDSGCVYGGRLSCVALEAGQNPRILAV